VKYLILVLLITAGCGSKNNAPGSEVRIDPLLTDPTRSPTGAVSDLAWLINDHRARLGLPGLLAVAEISREASFHAQDMSDGRLPLGHTGLANRCLSARRALGGGNACSEVVAAGQTNSESAMRSWMNSWGHRRIIEDPRFTRMGLGVSVSRTGRPYWTVIFLQY
jgi:uncharacterized protein YkwD